MKKKRLLPVATFVLGLSLLAAPLAFAEQGADDSASTSSTNSSAETHAKSQEKTKAAEKAAAAKAAKTGSGENESETEHATETETHTGSDDSLHQHAKKLLSDERTKGKQHTTEQRQQACEKRIASVKSQTNTLGSNAQRHLDRFNKILTNVQAYQEQKQLAASNYDSLLADATAQQAAATSAVNALKALNGSVDCTATDPAAGVATVKAAAEDARTALQAYRTSLKTLVNALLQAKDTATTTGGEQ